MKKFLLLLSAIIILSACDLDLDAFRSETDSMIEDGKQSYYNIVEEVQAIQNKIIETKAKIEETVSDVENAVQKVEEAKNALDKITE